MSDPEFYSATELALLLGVPTRSITRLCADRTIEADKQFPPRGKQFWWRIPNTDATQQFIRDFPTGKYDKRKVKKETPIT